MNYRAAMRDIIRLLLFKSSTDEIRQYGKANFVIGMLCTWLAGIGRYWDNERVGLFQHLGLGSVVYVFVLAGFLYLFLKPWKLEGWSYGNLLIFITMTSPPAFIYAIPVEMIFNLETSRDMNLSFLAIVSLWRISLLVIYLKRAFSLATSSSIAGALIPNIVVIVSLTLLNLEKAVFNIMGGLNLKTSADSAYAVMFLVSVISVYITIPSLIWYLYILFKRRRQLK